MSRFHDTFALSVELAIMELSVPRIGLGTWKNTDPAVCAESVQTAIECGYRHIDTAQLYENEVAVGNGIASADIDRDELFVATKVQPGNLSYDRVLESTHESLNRLGLAVIDLLYVHWPIETYDPEETLTAFNELIDDKYIRAVGLSNFEPDLLDEAIEILETPMVAHQVEFHPLNPQPTLLERAQKADYWLVGYCPLGRGELLSHSVVEAISAETGHTPAQVLIAWALAKDNVSVIPKATGEAHIRENLAAQDCELASHHISQLDGISEQKRFVDPAAAPWNR